MEWDEDQVYILITLLIKRKFNNIEELLRLLDLLPSSHLISHCLSLQWAHLGSTNSSAIEVHSWNIIPKLPERQFD